jgi:hypothetical protein
MHGAAVHQDAGRRGPHPARRDGGPHAPDHVAIRERKPRERAVPRGDEHVPGLHHHARAVAEPIHARLPQQGPAQVVRAYERVEGHHHVRVVARDAWVDAGRAQRGVSHALLARSAVQEHQVGALRDDQHIAAHVHGPQVLGEVARPALGTVRQGDGAHAVRDVQLRGGRGGGVLLQREAHGGGVHEEFGRLGAARQLVCPERLAVHAQAHHAVAIRHQQRVPGRGLRRGVRTGHGPAVHTAVLSCTRPTPSSAPARPHRWSTTRVADQCTEQPRAASARAPPRWRWTWPR